MKCLVPIMSLATLSFQTAILGILHRCITISWIIRTFITNDMGRNKANAIIIIAMLQSQFNIRIISGHNISIFKSKRNVQINGKKFGNSNSLKNGQDEVGAFDFVLLHDHS